MNLSNIPESPPDSRKGTEVNLIGGDNENKTPLIGEEPSRKNTVVTLISDQ
jgi:hypothetical protein